MILKKIHYVWVGGKEKPKDVVRCIKTWKKYLPEYEIIEWNEKNFDINSHPFVKEAYKQKKWAFVSDYIRMYAIYNFGGIYFDTDVIVVKNLDNLLNNKAFIGFEDNDNPFTATFGAEKNHILIKRILDEYDRVDLNFNSSNTNTKIIKKILINEFGCQLGNKEQLLKGNIKVYKKEILCQPSLKSQTIHAFKATWVEKNNKINKINSKFRTHLTNKFMIVLYGIFKLLIIKPKILIGNLIYRRTKG